MFIVCLKRGQHIVKGNGERSEHIGVIVNTAYAGELRTEVRLQQLA